ncbi:MAG: tRNA (adenosine(37)-N6)-threonylcarbamoyltransferase complex transferase subunit TsaD [Planctomycetaceae bacterium]
MTAALLLAIETTCDETAAAVIDRKLHVHSSVIASQDELHERFGGVVPEIASRAHLRQILPVVDEALRKADATPADLSAIAVAVRPGLVGSLLVGLTAAKTLAAVQQIPLLGVDHVAAHIFACRMDAGRDVFPAIGFVVSGGHTNLYDCRDAVELELIGATIDDAAGEAFDKVAQILALPYPGGPAVAAAAESGDPAAFAFPRPLLHEQQFDFSFSGLKTAVRYAVRGGARGPESEHALSPDLNVADVCASFQEAAVDVLVAKCRQALQSRGRRTLCVGGGVAANRRLRERLTAMTADLGVELILAPPEMCTDNAAMAGIAWEMLDRGMTADLTIDVTPGLVRRKR